MFSYEPPPFDKEGLLVFKSVFIGLFIVILLGATIASVFHKQSKRIEALQKKVERLENGVSVFIAQDYISGEKKKYIAIGVATITDHGDKKGPVMPVLVSETAYEDYKDDLRLKLMEYKIGQDKKVADK